MLALPDPVAGGKVEALRELLHLSDDDWRLLLSWAVGGFRAAGPYPILGITGAQGSGKTTTCRMIRALGDPNVSSIRALPREERDLAIAGGNAHILAFDNVSTIPNWLSDALCRVATGGGFSTRALYENDEETLFSEVKPILLNGISGTAGRADLADRLVQIEVDAIEEDGRKTETELWTSFRAAAPGILGGLMDIVSEGLRRLPSTRPPRLSRMADFELWVTACEPGLGWEAGSFHRLLNGARARIVDEVLSDDPLAEAIVRYLTGKGSFKGTATELLNELDSAEGLTEKKHKPHGWPHSARALGHALKRLAPALLQGRGVAVMKDPTNKARVIQLGKVVETSSPSSPKETLV